MKAKWFITLVFLILFGLGSSLAREDHLPGNVDFGTLVTCPLAFEGLTGDRNGNLYTAERGGDPCLVKRIDVATRTDEVVGHIPAPCTPSGIAFDKDGFLLIADAPGYLQVKPDPVGIGPGPAATLFVTGVVPGTNGLALDRHGNLWTGDGTTGLGRVWKITPAGVVTKNFAFNPWPQRATN